MPGNPAPQENKQMKLGDTVFVISPRPRLISKGADVEYVGPPDWRVRASGCLVYQSRHHVIISGSGALTERGHQPVHLFAHIHDTFADRDAAMNAARERTQARQEPIDGGLLLDSRAER